MPEFDQKAFDKQFELGARTGTNRQLVLGATYQARAYQSEDSEEAASYFDRAVSAFEEAQRVGTSDAFVSIVAGYTLASVGITRPLYADKAFPSQETLGTVNENVVRFLYDSIAKARSSSDKRILALYDSAAGVCLYNFWGGNVYPYGNPNWAATLSFSRTGSSEMLRGLVDDGHVTIFGPGKTGPEVKYQVHIKSEEVKKGQKPQPVPEGQKVVSVSRHLKIGGEKTISARQILIDMFQHRDEKSEKRALRFVQRLSTDQVPHR